MRSSIGANGRGDLEGVDSGCKCNGVDGTGGWWGKATGNAYIVDALSTIGRTHSHKTYRVGGGVRILG